MITKIVFEKDLHRIKELTNTRFENMSNRQRKAVLEKALIFLFQTISHEDVLSSLLLKIAIDIIYNFLFESLERCVIKLFTYAALTLYAIKIFSESNVIFAYLEASLAVLQKIVDLNDTILILAKFHSLLQQMFECLEEEIQSIDNLSIHRSRQSLSRIQRRLDLSSAMSSIQMTSKNITNSLIIFEISQKMSRSFSMKDSRHDNDYKNITNIKIMSITLKIQSYRLKYLSFDDFNA